MKCPDCHCECVVGGMITASGSKVVIERCPKCHGNPDPKKAFLPKKDYDWERLPTLIDNSANQRCQVEGCTNVGAEWHHFAPRHLFDDADAWPAAWICLPHHREWHEKTKTGSYAKRKS